MSHSERLTLSLSSDAEVSVSGAAIGRGLLSRAYCLEPTDRNRFSVDDDIYGVAARLWLTGSVHGERY